jgi:hypothetical protein
LKLKDLEQDIELLEKSVQKAAALSKEVEQMDNQVEMVRQDLLEELNSMNEKSSNGRK